MVLSMAYRGLAGGLGPYASHCGSLENTATSGQLDQSVGVKALGAALG